MEGPGSPSLDLAKAEKQSLVITRDAKVRYVSYVAMQGSG